MKINEITEGFGSALGSAFARYVGADTAANTIDQGQKWDLPTGFSFPGVVDSSELMKNPANADRIVNVMTAWAGKNGGKMAPGTVGAAIKTKFPKYWATEQNKGAVVSAIEKAVQAKGVKIAPAAPVTKDEPISIGSEPLDPSSPLYKQIQAKLSGK